ncbi:MAG: HDOD domain-containing protein [Pseudomonadota bacterium]
MSISDFIDKAELRIALDLINKVQIPSPPKVLLELKAELALADPSRNKIVTLIKSDIGLVSRVLKVLNSAAFNLAEEITSIEQAISLIGFNRLKTIIIQPAYQHALSQSINGFDNISNFSHLVGNIAETIGDEIESELSGHFYLCGLFHQVGVLVLSKVYPEYMDFYLSNHLHPLSFPVLEKERYHVNHFSISVLLAKSWGLSNTVCNAIFLQQIAYATYKDNMDSATITLVSILKISKYLALKNSSLFSLEQCDECAICYDTSVAELMLDETTIKNIEQSIDSY